MVISGIRDRVDSGVNDFRDRVGSIEVPSPEIDFSLPEIDMPDRDSISDYLLPTDIEFNPIESTKGVVDSGLNFYEDVTPEWIDRNPLTNISEAGSRLSSSISSGIGTITGGLIGSSGSGNVVEESTEEAEEWVSNPSQQVRRVSGGNFSPLMPLALLGIPILLFYTVKR